MSMWYTQGPGALNVFDGSTNTQIGRLSLSGKDRVTMVGTGRMLVASPGTSPATTRTLGSLMVDADLFIQHFQRVVLNASTRVTLSGTGELRVFDFYPVGRLVLAGRGG